MKTDTVFKSKKDKKTSEVAPKQIHNLPGIDNSLVLDSHPVYRWENSSVSYTFDMNREEGLFEINVANLFRIFPI